MECESAASLNYRRSPCNGKYQILIDIVEYQSLKNMEWISVKDHLPESDVPVLLYHHPYIGVDMRTNPKDGNIWSSTSKESVTHWMPLPPNPKD